MKTWIAVKLPALLFLFLLPMEVDADWKSEWERVVDAAKKEARLNLYVGRYGQAPLLEEFKKEHPEIKLVTVNGTGDQPSFSAELLKTTQMLNLLDCQLSLRNKGLELP